MIEPMFMGFTVAIEFENIIAVTEERSGHYQSYYLTKSGRIIGKNSLHIINNGGDCENEGFIRFSDKKTDMVGLFDKNGKYYIFTDTEKEINQWLKMVLIPNLTLSKLEFSTMDSLTYWKKTQGWITVSKEYFLTRNIELIQERLQSILLNNSDHFISIKGLNPFLGSGEVFDKYYNNCGEARLEKYPVMGLIINNRTDSNFTQDHFNFLKTDEGYQFISLTIRNGKIK